MIVITTIRPEVLDRIESYTPKKPEVRGNWPFIADTVRTAVLAADDPHQFAAVRAVRGKLDGYPTPTTWTGHLLHAPRPAGRLVVQNLGTGITDLVVAAAVVERAEASATGQVVDI